MNAVARFRRDVLDQPGVHDVILLEGTNDIGMGHTTGWCSAPHREVSAAQIIAKAIGAGSSCIDSPSAQRTASRSPAPTGITVLKRRNRTAVPTSTPSGARLKRLTLT